MGAFFALILTISSVSGTTINSPDDIITVEATASGLKSPSQYLQIAIAKEGTTKYFGLTKNTADEWYQYKSSSAVKTEDLVYFFSFPLTGGSWWGQIQGKIDVNDPNFEGPGDYFLKLVRFTSGGSSTDSTNSATLKINVSVPVTNQKDISTILVIPSPVIEFIVPSAANLGENFKTTVSLKNFAANTEFYLKIRDKVQTKNSNNFLSDNEAWNLFPLIKTDNSGNWSGEIRGIISEDKDAGIYKIKLRVRKKDADSFFESDIKEIKLSKIITPVVIVTTPSAEINNFDVVLGTHSASISPEVKLPEPVKIKEKFDKLSLIILILGGIFSLAGVWGIIRKR